MMVRFMKSRVLSGLLAPLRRSARRLARDKRGVAAVEFAIVVPLMMVMFFGMIEFTGGVAVKRKVSMATQALGDLASRYQNVVDQDITNFFAIADAMLMPYSTTPLQATITEIYIDPATGIARAQWSKGDAPRSAGSPVPVPANLVARDALNNIVANQYLIFTETSYLYVPAVGYVMRASVPLGDINYMKPRLTMCVLYGSAAGVCPTS